MTYWVYASLHTKQGKWMSLCANGIPASKIPDRELEEIAKLSTPQKHALNPPTARRNP